MSENSPNHSKGLMASLSAMAATLVAIIHTRLDLLSTDIEEEREHLLSLVALSLIALFCLMVGVVLMTVLLIVALWETYRLLAIGSLAGVFLTAGLIAWYLVKRKAKAKPRLFLASLLELRKDRQKLDPHH
jgi:uncharacterized membrane protein YqjE